MGLASIPIRYGLLAGLVIHGLLVPAQRCQDVGDDWLIQRYGAAQAEDMRTNAHHRFVAMKVYATRSFEVVENGQARVPTCSEILLIDLFAHDPYRNDSTAVQRYDTALSKEVRLLSRAALEQLVMDRFSAADLAAYMRDKARASGSADKTVQ